MTSRFPLLWLVAAVVIGATGCGHHNIPAAHNIPPYANAPTILVVPNAPIEQGEEGIASWYGNPFHGRRAASGEVFNMYDMTAAHRTLPFGTQVKVHDLENGHEVIVRINDRGPFVEGRIIDLSYAAAQSMGMNGIARVRLEILGMSPEPGVPPSPTPAPSVSPLPAAAPVSSVNIDDTGIFAVQVGAFGDPQKADRLKALIEAEYSPVTIERYDSGNGVFYRVRVGQESTEAGAIELAAKLRGSNLATTTLVVRMN